MMIIEENGKLFRKEEMAVEDIEREILLLEEQREDIAKTIDKYQVFLPVVEESTEEEQTEETEENIDNNTNPTY